MKKTYWTDDDALFWKNVLASTPIDEMWDLIKLLHGYEITECAFHDDYGDNGILTWLDDTMCCHMDLSDPPFWFTIALVRNFIRKHGVAR